MKTRAYIATILVVVLGACATPRSTPPRIDGSTPQTFESSWHALLKGLNADQKARLETAVFLIGATKAHKSGAPADQQFGPETLRAELDGKTFQEVLDAGAATGSRIERIERAR
jgi:hypothetical protein